MDHLAAIGQYAVTHWLGILLSIVATYVIGFTWHGPLFGKLWMDCNGMKAPKKEDMKFSMMLPGLSASFVQVLVQSAILGRTFQLLGLTSVWDALLIGAILSFAFTGLSFINSRAWEGKTAVHMALDVGYYLVTTLASSAILFATL